MGKTVLYHYSKSPHSTLKTLSMQGISDERKMELMALSKARGSNYPYYDSLSLFLDPIPLDLMSGIFYSDHPVWFSGSKLLPHAVEVDSLSLKYWTLIESSVDEVLNPLWMDVVFYKRIHGKLKSNIKYLVGQNGYDLDSLKRCVAKHGGKTREQFENIGRTDSRQYAAGVTHLMVYPTKPVNVKSVTPVVVK